MLFVLILPVQAANWKQIDAKEYVDLDSIEKYNYAYSIRNDDIYSFWIKNLNDKGPDFINFEKRYNKKIWYLMTRYLVDCKNKTIATKVSVIYNLSAQVIDSYEKPDYSIEWASIIPESIGESYYYGVCVAK